jgi:hypothetical protein
LSKTRGKAAATRLTLKGKKVSISLLQTNRSMSNVVITINKKTVDPSTQDRSAGILLAALVLNRVVGAEPSQYSYPINPTVQNAT